MAMHLAHTYKLHMKVTLPAALTTRSPQHQLWMLPTSPRPLRAPATGATTRVVAPKLPVPQQAPAQRSFCRLSPAEMLEHRCQGLCFNYCDFLADDVANDVAVAMELSDSIHAIIDI